ncbi:MAG: nucleotidyltransferase domain-containing protein [Elusimicrobiota bacterium]
MKIKTSEIINYVRQIKQKFNPSKIILFGSYAYGKPSKDSDVDLLVIMKTDLKPIEQAVLIRKEFPAPFPLDLIVRTSQEVKKRIKKGDFFLTAVIKEGKIL